MFGKLICLISFVVLTISASSVQAFVTVTTADGNGADTYLSNDGQSGDFGPDSVHGTEEIMRAFRQLADTRSKAAYIRFDLSNIGGDMNDAILTFETSWNKGSGGKIVDVYGLIDGPNDILWDEATTSYNNASVMIPNPPTTLGNYALNMDDVVLLGTIITPAEYPVIFSSDVSNLPLKDFLNADTNKRVTFLFIGGNDECEIASKENPTLSPPTLTLPYALGLKASNPSPNDLATSVSVATDLSWTPGLYAGTHDVYLGTDFNDVNDADRDNPLGVLDKQDHDANSYEPGALNVSTTYYWRIDEVNDTNIWKGDVWSFTTGAAEASNPSPYNDEICVFVDETLSWSPGTYAQSHDVYFGTTNPPPFVQNQPGTTYDPPGDMLYNTTYYWKITEVNGPNTWEGDVWQFTTIPDIPIEDPHLVGWWKFDEGPGKAIDWSGLGQHGTVYGGAESVEGYEDDGINLDGDDDYVELPIGTTISTLDSTTIATWVNFTDTGLWWQRIFDFGNSSTTGYMFLTTRGLDNGNIRFAITLTTLPESVLVAPYALPTGWHHVAVAIDDSFGDMTLFVDGAVVDNQLTDFLPSELGVTANNWLGRSQYAVDAYFSGILDDFRIYDFAMTEEDLKTVMASKVASLPEPADYSTGVDRNPVLTWQPGRYAADMDGHELYYSTEFNDVNERIGDPVVLTNPTYTIPSPNAPYESLQTVFWVVDEVNDSHPDKIWQGNVWQFTIKDYSVIDDFNDYSDTGKSTPPPAGTLKSVWVDGNYAFYFLPPVVPGTSGSLVQLNTDTHDGLETYEHYQPGNFAKSGAQSMKFYYDNDGYVSWMVDLYGAAPPDIYSYVPDPDTYLSEAYAAIDDAAQTDPDLDSLDLMRDWNGYKVLQLSFFGDPNNDTEPMYVGLEDGDGTLVTIEHPNPDLTEQQWQDWYVALSQFTVKDSNLALGDIAKIYIGFGDKDSPASGGTGLVFFDDIQLFETGICIPGSVVGDFDDDCVIDNADLEIFTYSFPGEMPTLPTPIINLSAAGLPAGPLSSWSNSSGSGGGVFTDVNTDDPNKPVVETIAGKKCVTFDATDMLVWDQNAPATLTSDTNAPNDFTVIYEVYNPEIADEEILLTWAQRGGPAGTTAGFGYGSYADWGAVVHWNEGDQLPDMGFDRGVPVAGQWHIIAVTYDGTTEALVTDGAIHNLEDKDLAIYADQPVTIGAPFEVPADSNDAYIRGTYVPTYGSYPYRGSVASIKVYGEAIPPGDLAILTAGLAGLSNAKADVKPDGKIDFGDLAVMGYKWMEDPYLFGEDY